MKKIILTTFAAVSTLFASDSITGNWNTGKENSIVFIQKNESGRYVGTLVSSDNQNAPVGSKILRNFSHVDGEWRGSIYVVKRRMVRDATLSCQGDTLLLEIDAGFRTEKVHWVRVEN